jgi:hypothetical protein
MRLKRGQLAALQEELNTEYQARNGLAKPASTEKPELNYSAEI